MNNNQELYDFILNIGATNISNENLDAVFGSATGTPKPFTDGSHNSVKVTNLSYTTDLHIYDDRLQETGGIIVPPRENKLVRINKPLYAMAGKWKTSIPIQPDHYVSSLILSGGNLIAMIVPREPNINSVIKIRNTGLIIYSSDFGDSWTTSTGHNGIQQGGHIVPIGNGRLAAFYSRDVSTGADASSYSSTIAVSDDGGITWTVKSTGLLGPTSNFREAFLLTAASIRGIVVGCPIDPSLGLVRSTDNGETWALVDNTNYNQGGDTFRRGFLISDPFRDRFFLFNGVREGGSVRKILVYSSTDGLTWTEKADLQNEDLATSEQHRVGGMYWNEITDIGLDVIPTLFLLPQFNSTKIWYTEEVDGTGWQELDNPIPNGWTLPFFPFGIPGAHPILRDKFIGFPVLYFGDGLGQEDPTYVIPPFDIGKTAEDRQGFIGGTYMIDHRTKQGEFLSQSDMILGYAGSFVYGSRGWHQLTIADNYGMVPFSIEER